MALGIQAQTANNPFVLLISDRPTERAALERAIALVMDCRAVAAGSAIPAGRPHLIILDLHPAQAAAFEPALTHRGRPIPRLVLVRGEPLSPAPHLRQLPAAAPRQLVLANVFAMIEAVTRSVETRMQRLVGRVTDATGIVAELFDSAALGAGLQRADVERGIELVLAAVSEAGITAWLAEVWRHDVGVYQHTLGVAGHAASFGAQIGLSRIDLARLVRSALLHDIGKSRIPTEILNKPGHLDPEELRLMQRHPVIGADLLRAQGGFEAEVIDVVLHHHERLDGNGYPDRLSGRAISDLVRIVAICDVFSALTERRAYRQPASPAEALAIMVDGIGHLDPDLLRVFAPVMLGGDALAA
ncbi:MULTISPECIES: HD domain-containing phosphohydrolase [unclassified Methylobacterium]|uniref:HD-GYP domain-containing protein n=1 Tax=unclassified Methylobacterium TaxID=2615210 RepID=UPI0011C201A0|nr:MULTISPECIES: HD domain-containing phosphohydrolase [unclassified Methylobacterium]QEE40032.1 HD domain-containing protein [Methylobacterium sp. WL1]TXN58609.1 HD domain-containing protein [Methylobacterium sp. WL2]